MAAILVGAGILGAVGYLSKTASESDRDAMAREAAQLADPDVGVMAGVRQRVQVSARGQDAWMLAQLHGARYQFLRTETGEAGAPFDIYWDPVCNHEVRRAHGARIRSERH